MKKLLIIAMLFISCTVIQGCADGNVSASSVNDGGIVLEKTAKTASFEGFEGDAGEYTENTEENADAGNDENIEGADDMMDFSEWKNNMVSDSENEQDVKETENIGETTETDKIALTSISSNEAVTETDDPVELITNKAIKKFQGYDVGNRSDMGENGEIEVKFSPDDSRAVYADGLGILLYWSNDDGNIEYEWWNGES